MTAIPHDELEGHYIQPAMAATTQLDRGMLLRDVRAQTLDGREVRASDFRGRRNLVVIFPGDAAEESRLLGELRQRSLELQEEETTVLIAGDDGLRHLYGAIAPEARRIAALYVADRYGEIYFAAHSEPGRPLPGASDALEWLRFINAQCPE